MKTSNKILIRGVNWLGDAVMTLPAIESIKIAFPEYKIDVNDITDITDITDNMSYGKKQRLLNRLKKNEMKQHRSLNIIQGEYQDDAVEELPRSPGKRTLSDDHGRVDIRNIGSRRHTLCAISQPIRPERKLPQPCPDEKRRGRQTAAGGTVNL